MGRITMRGSSLCLMTVLAMMFTNGCGGGEGGVADSVIKKGEQLAEAKYSRDDLDPRISAAHLSFGFDLYREVRQSRAAAKTEAGTGSGTSNGIGIGTAKEGVSPVNDFISPLSIATVLAMTSNGAAGGTLEAMRNTLKLGSMNMDEINRGHEVLIDQLTHSNKEVKLSLANSLWAKQGLIFKAPFLASGKEQFGAEITSLDMASPKSPGKINGWVDKQTNGKIKDIVKAPLDAQTAMILLNAVYFNGNWESPFDKSLTKEQPFFQSGDGAATTDVNVNMMHKQGLISYAKGDGFQAVNLPYKGRSISMLVFLPDKSVGLDGFLDRLTVDNWNTWLKAFRPSIEELGLPRFQTTYELSLKKPLETIGMKTAFDPMHADFNNMLTLADNVYLSEVKHKAFIDVQEKGTEAAAATSVHAVGTSAPAVPTEPFQMEVDRPFFYAIYDSNTASILFMGSVRRPG